MTSGFEVIEREAIFDEYEILSRKIAEEYFKTDNISGVDIASVCFDGEFIYAVLSCYQNETSQLPDLGEMVIKYEIASNEVEILMVHPAGDMVRKMVLCEQNLLIKSLEEWVIYRYDIKKDEITIFAPADSEIEYTGSTAISSANSWFIYCEYFGRNDFKVHFILLRLEKKLF